MPTVAESEIVVTASTASHDKAMVKVVAAQEKAAEKQVEAERKAQAAIGKEIAKRTADEEKANSQRVKNALRASEIVYQFKQKENARLLKLEQARLKEEAKLQEKARAEAAKAAAGQTFMGKIKGIQQSPFISEAETIASLGITAGGAISKVSMLATSAIRPVAFLGAGISALGPAGMAAAAGIAAIAAPVAGLAIASKVVYGLADSAVEAEKRLRDMGLAADIPEESRAGVVAYKAAQTELAIELDKVTLALGSKMIPYAITLTNATRGLVMATEDWTTSLGNLDGGFSGFLERTENALANQFPLTAAALKGAADLWGGAASAAIDYGESIAKAADAGANLDEFGMPKQSDFTPQDIAEGRENQAKLDEVEGARQQKIADENARKAKEALTEATRKQKEAAAELDRELKANAAAGNARTAEMNRNYQKWIDDKKAADAEMLRAEHAARDARVAAAKAEDDRLKEIEEDRKERRKRDIEASIVGITQLVAATADIFEMQAEKAAEALGRISDRQDKLREENASYQQDAKKYSKELANAQNEQSRLYYYAKQQEAKQDAEDNEAKLQRLRERENEERKALVRAFNRSKAASISETVINGAVALVKAVATLGPIAGAIAAAGIAAGTGVAIAKIAAQKPPEYPIGRPPASSPDHPTRVAIQDEEAILTARGVKAIGGPDAVTDANSGTYNDEQVVKLMRVETLELVEPNGRKRKKVLPDVGKRKGRR